MSAALFGLRANAACRGLPTRLASRCAVAAAFAATVLLGACSSSSKRPDPAPLQAFTPSLTAPLQWSQRVGAMSTSLTISVAGQTVVVADRDGSVMALQLDTGREVWRASAGDRLTAGVGSDGKYASVVTRENELVTFDGGAVKWRQPLATRVLTPPLVAGERVFVMGIDRVVRAFDALDGRRLWTQSRPGDALSLSEASVIAPFKNTLLVGQGPRLAGLDPTLGTVRWDVPIATPRGTNEVERLADLVAPLARVGDTVCARSFQAAVTCVDAERGAVLWTRTSSGNDGIGADDQFVFGGDAVDRLTGWRMASGDVAWTSDSFIYRGLSAPAVMKDAVAFGDSQGIVHLLARDSGRTLQRMNTDGSAIDAAPVVAGGLLLVSTRSGGLFAFRPQ
ncbi:outer membrane protein assembly factor BamB [soil metagenome]